jgi:hypothetical protein
MSSVTITFTDNPNDVKVVDIKWEVSDENEGHSASKALASYILDHLESIRNNELVTDAEPKE